MSATALGAGAGAAPSHKKGKGGHGGQNSRKVRRNRQRGKQHQEEDGSFTGGNQTLVKDLSDKTGFPGSSQEMLGDGTRSKEAGGKVVNKKSKNRNRKTAEKPSTQDLSQATASESPIVVKETHVTKEAMMNKTRNSDGTIGAGDNNTTTRTQDAMSLADNDKRGLLESMDSRE